MRCRAGPSSGGRRRASRRPSSACCWRVRAGSAEPPSVVRWAWGSRSARSGCRPGWACPPRRSSSPRDWSASSGSPPRAWRGRGKGVDRDDLDDLLAVWSDQFARVRRRCRDALDRADRRPGDRLDHRAGVRRGAGLRPGAARSGDVRGDVHRLSRGGPHGGPGRDARRLLCPLGPGRGHGPASRPAGSPPMAERVPPRGRGRGRGPPRRHGPEPGAPFPRGMGPPGDRRRGLPPGPGDKAPSRLDPPGRCLLRDARRLPADARAIGIIQTPHPQSGSRTMSHFDAVADDFDRFRALPAGVPAAIRDAMWEALGLARGGRVLDLGAGTGRVGAAFVAAGDAYIAVDPSAGMLARFAEKAATQGGSAPSPALVQADGRALPFPGSAFDAVLLVQVLSGAPGWRSLLTEARRVLRPDGGLVLGKAIGPPEGVDARMRAQVSVILAELGADARPRGAQREEA